MGVMVVVLEPAFLVEYLGASVEMATILHHPPLLCVMLDWYGVDFDHPRPCRKAYNWFGSEGRQHLIV